MYLFIYNSQSNYNHYWYDHALIIHSVMNGLYSKQRFVYRHTIERRPNNLCSMFILQVPIFIMNIIIIFWYTYHNIKFIVYFIVHVRLVFPSAFDVLTFDIICFSTDIVLSSVVSIIHFKRPLGLNWKSLVNKYIIIALLYQFLLVLLWEMFHNDQKWIWNAIQLVIQSFDIILFTSSFFYVLFVIINYYLIIQISIGKK